MKPRPQSGVFLAGALVAAVIGIGALPATPLPSEAPVQPRSESAQPKRSHGNSGRSAGKGVEQEFGFNDFNGHSFQFSCNISPQADRDLRGLEAFDFCPGPASPPGVLAACYRPELKRVHFNRTASPQEYANYMQHRGRQCDGEGWGLDYGAVITEAREPLRDCRQKLAEQIGRENSQALEAFLLSIPGEEMDDVDVNLKKWTLGLRIPTSVMLEKQGDCDSKSALFCSLYGGKRELVMLRSVPNTCKDTSDGFPPRRQDKDHPEDQQNKGHAMVGIGADGNQPPFPERYPDWWEDLESKKIEEGSYTETTPVTFGERSFIPIEVNVKRGVVEFGQVVRECQYQAIPIPALGKKSFDPAPAASGCVQPVRAGAWTISSAAPGSR